MIGIKRFYHFTFASTLFPILGLRAMGGPPAVREGIKPSVHPVFGLTTLYEPVVWLTERPDMKPTPADLEWLKSPLCPLSPENIAEFCKEGPIGDRTAMLVVELSTAGKRLQR